MLIWWNSLRFYGFFSIPEVLFQFCEWSISVRCSYLRHIVWITPLNRERISLLKKRSIGINVYYVSDSSKLLQRFVIELPCFYWINFEYPRLGLPPVIRDWYRTREPTDDLRACWMLPERRVLVDPRSSIRRYRAVPVRWPAWPFLLPVDRTSSDNRSSRIGKGATTDRNQRSCRWPWSQDEPNRTAYWRRSPVEHAKGNEK